MIKVFTAQNFIEVMFWKNFLEQHDVECVMKNEFLGSAAGEVPPIECWPELWITDERDEPLAKRLIKSDPLADQQNLAVWTCASCGEESEGQFSDCWNCGAARDNF